MRTYLLITIVFIASSVFALQPPEKGEIGRLRSHGDFQKQLDRALMYGNHKVKPELAARTLSKLRALFPTENPDKTKPMTPLPAWQGMPTTGTNKILVFLIEFPDASNITTHASVTNQLFGDGISSHYPRESLQNYYWRASYGKLLIEGTALGWYMMQHSREWYTNTYGDGNNANYQITKEVAEHFDATHDYSQYDNNGDGNIDYFAVIWSGRHGEWASFWWGYQWSLYSNLTLDGVRFYDFSWQWESYNYPSGFFDPLVIIHETGHALGLPDYYDYNGDIGPDGGVGGLDMMAGNRGDHNAFSKFMLDWLQPTNVVDSLLDYTLKATAEYPEAVMVMPGVDNSTPYKEYFMVQNRYRVLNDTNYPSDGLLIWHIDATPNSSGNNFEYDNSYASHKLLRLMEADGLEEIENNGWANAGDYYNSGETFDPHSTPNSKNYGGSNSMVSVSDISADGITMTADIDILPEPALAIIALLSIIFVFRKTK
jgi:M6 family metalloprotease-like protein